MDVILNPQWIENKLTNTQFCAETKKSETKTKAPDVVELLIEKKDFFLAQLIIGQRIHFFQNNEENEKNASIFYSDEKIKSILQMGLCFEEREYYNEAIKCYSQLENHGLNFIAQSKIGDLYYKIDEINKAENAYLESLLYTQDCNDSNRELFQAYSKETFNIYKNLGNINLKKGQIKNAESFYLKALAINSQSSDLYVNLATLELLNGNETLALEKYRKAISLNDKNDKAWSGLALIYDSFGDYELTNACLKKAIELNEKNTNALHLYSQLCLKNNKAPEAIGILEKWLAKYDFNVDVSIFLIELYAHINETVKAKELLEFALLMDPQNKYLNDWYLVLQQNH